MTLGDLVDALLLSEDWIVKQGLYFGVTGFETDLPVFGHLLPLFEPGVYLVAVDIKLKVGVHMYL